MVITAFGHAETTMADPVIPDNETTTYSVTTGKEIYTVSQTVKHTKNTPLSQYEIVSHSRKSDQRILINRSTMEVVYSWVKHKETDYEMETEIKINKNSLKAKPGEVVILNFQGINHVLRGFPFSKNRTVKIKTAAGGDFVLTVTPKGEKDIKTKMGTIRCYELELGMDGFFGAFFPKTRLWYSKAAPHFLVKYEGPSGGPGSENMIIEITSYSGS